MGEGRVHRLCFLPLPGWFRAPPRDVVESATVMMKTRFPRVAAAIAMAATFALTGCIKSDHKTTLNKDGSGVVTARMEMDLTQLKALADLAGSFGGGAPGG